MYYIGIDIGGSFTDTILMDEKGELHLYKTESTPLNLTAGVINGLKLAAEDLKISVEELLKDTSYFGHGTTIATNTFIERKGVKTGLITTKGFRDTILIQRAMGSMAGMLDEEIVHYSLRSLPSPIVPLSLIKEVTERVDYKGEVIVPLNKGEVRKAVKELVNEGVRSIAVCLLWSFRNPEHEREIKKIITEEAPFVFTSISSELVPLIREYERTATTVINSYLGPPVAQYVGNLDEELKGMGLNCPFLLLNSIGGMIPAEDVPEKVSFLLMSGPAGGVLSSAYLGGFLGYKNIITTDMGGTSFDAGLIVDGKPTKSLISLIGKYHLMIPMISIETIGAGGGSIAYVEDGNLRVGPKSAGADPGPVCYDKGGEEPTVTDADIVLGVINPDYFLGGRVKLNKEKAEVAIREKIAKPLRLGLVEAAAGIKMVVDSQMADLLRQVTIEKGYDPRDFVLFAYGGAGPTHSFSYGAELNIKSIIVPATSAVHSAFGTVTSNILYSFEISHPMRTPTYFDKASKYLDWKKINESFKTFKGRGTQALKRSNIKEEDMYFSRYLDMRYRRQTHELSVPVPGEELTPKDLDDVVDQFEKIYEKLYGKGTAYREAGVEITAFRMEAEGVQPKPRLKEYERGGQDPSKAFKEERRVYFNETKDFATTKVYEGSRMERGNMIKGPAIIEYPGTTVVIGPHQRGMVDKFLNIIIEI